MENQIRGHLTGILRRFAHADRSANRCTEIKHRCQYRRASAPDFQTVLWLMERLGLRGGTVRPIYIGDDVTDEDAFRVLQEWGAGIVVHAGEERCTNARYGLVDPEEVLTFLQNLSVAIRQGE